MYKQRYRQSKDRLSHDTEFFMIIVLSWEEIHMMRYDMEMVDQL